MSTKNKSLTDAAHDRTVKQVDTTLKILDAIGYAMGRAMPLIAAAPPTDFEAAGYTNLQLDKLYNEILAAKVGDTNEHFLRAAVVNGLMIGIKDWQAAQRH